MSEINHIAVAHFTGGRTTTVPGLWQYDYGQILQIVGLDLPSSYEVHFSNSEKFGESKSQIGDENGVAIPDEYLETGDPVYAFIFLHDAETDGETEYKIKMPVKQRPKPTDIEPTPVQQDVITEAIAALNSAVTQTSEYASAAHTSEENAANSAQVAEEYKNDAEHAAQSIQTMNVEANTLVPGSQATADWNDGTLTLGIPEGQKGATGEKGDKGDPGATGAKGDKGEKGDKGDTGEKGDPGTPGSKGDKGDRGEKGEKGDTGATGAKGAQGAQGIPGVSPTVTVTDITGGHRITITDAEHPQGVSFDVMDGSDADAPVQDVQVNGVSVLNNKIGNIPRATNTTLGVVRGGSGVGINPNSGEAYILKAYDNVIQPGEGAYSPIVPFNQHCAVFFGLSKVAGADLKNKTVALGTYPEASKSAIHEMLSGSITVSGTTHTINALPGLRYICGEVSTLTVNLPASGCVDVQFESGSTPTVLTVVPASGQTVKWANGFDPDTLDADTTYEINIADGLGVAGSWT